MSRTPELYPDLVQAGGLAPCLQIALIQIGSSLTVSSLAEIVDEEQREVMSRFAQ